MKKRHIYTFQQHLEESLKDPEFRKAWDESEAEYQLACQVIEARLKRKLSQRALAKKAKTSQTAIARIEGMDANPTFASLKRIARALDGKLTISFGG